jgi:signal transduction histidine kinase
VTDPGQFAPIVKVSRVRKIGSAAAPAATTATLEELLSGGLDAQWVKVSGVVRSVDSRGQGSSGPWRMELALGGGKVSVVATETRPAEGLVDAKVRVQATCLYQFTQGRKVLRPILFVPPNVPIEIIEPAPADADAPLRPAGSLLEFSPENTSGHRVHVRGVVTHQEPGTIVWIRDESGGLRVQTRQAGQLHAGDEIDVLGFPKYGSYTPTLEDAVFVKRGSTNPPGATELASLTNAFDHPGDLISLVATLTESERTPDGWLFMFQREGSSVKAFLKTPAGSPLINHWEPSSVLRVSGICSVVVDEVEPVTSGVWRPETFHLLLRATSDIALVKAPPWWTTKRKIWGLLIVTSGSLMVTAAVMLLTRRRLREQMHRRAMAEAEFAAILSERNRVAREIHDTLAQGLAATSVHLRLARKNVDGSPEEPLAHHLDLAQQLVRDSLEEARNSIWNMRSQVLETDDLAGALKGILHQMADGTNVKCHFETVGAARRLAPVLENNILRVGQEAISNALRHANGQSISVHLVFGQKHFRLDVKDDGRGFDLAKPPPGNGGFGLVGMRERAAHINGHLNIKSESGRGTELTLEVPLSGE